MFMNSPLECSIEWAPHMIVALNWYFPLSRFETSQIIGWFVVWCVVASFFGICPPSIHIMWSAIGFKLVMHWFWKRTRHSRNCSQQIFMNVTLYAFQLANWPLKNVARTIRTAQLLSTSPGYWAHISWALKYHILMIFMSRIEWLHSNENRDGGSFSWPFLNLSPEFCQIMINIRDGGLAWSIFTSIHHGHEVQLMPSSRNHITRMMLYVESESAKKFNPLPTNSI